MEVSKIAQRKEIEFEKLNAMIDFAENKVRCRSRILLGYFGEKNTNNCGACDYCLESSKPKLSDAQLAKIEAKVKPLLKEKSLTIKQLQNALIEVNPDTLVSAIRFWADKGIIAVNTAQEIIWTELKK